MSFDIHDHDGVTHFGIFEGEGLRHTIFVEIEMHGSFFIEYRSNEKTKTNEFTDTNDLSH